MRTKENAVSSHYIQNYSSLKRKRSNYFDYTSAMRTQNDISSDSQGGSIQHSDGMFDESSVPPTPSATNSLQLYGDCGDKIEPRDDTFLTLRTQSSEVDRHGSICDGDRSTCQSIIEETNCGLFTSADLKKNIDAECDLPDELFYSELNKKREDVTQGERVTPGGMNCTFHNKRHTQHTHCVINIHRCDDATFPIQNMHSRELNRPEYPSDADGDICQETSEDTNLCLSANAMVKRQNPDTECDVLDKRFHSELDMKHADQHQDKRAIPDNVTRNSNNSRDAQYSNCIIKVEPCDDETFLTRNTYSGEADRPGYPCYGINIYQGSSKTNFGLSSSTSVKRENAGADRDFPDEVHSELNLKHMNVTQEKTVAPDVVNLTSNNSEMLHSGCVIKVEPRDDENCPTQNAHSRELETHGNICDGDRIMCQRTGEDTNLGLFVSTSVKKEIIGAECDLPDELFHTELDLKLEDVPQEARGTPESAIASAVEHGEALAGDCNSANDVRQGSGAWSHIKEKPFKCAECDYSATKRSNLNLHRRIHTGEKPFKCAECDYSAVQKNSLIQHSRIHTGEKPFKCAECDYSAAQKTTLIQHRRIHTGEKPFKCAECDYSAAQKTSLILHRRIHTGEKPFKCVECDYSANQKSNLILHRRIHSGEKPFKCAECDYRATQKTCLILHRRIHTGEKPFKCTECNYTATQKSRLIAHKHTHTGEKPYKCSKCNYSAAEKRNLITHTLTHTEHKPFKCAECDYSATRRSNLIQHMRIHTGEKPFKCAECDYRAAQRANLNAHKRKHAAEMPYKCSELL